tara:strand:- start:77 stop:826 length:750 start_codon:yes stop_codon:yes gene_type:complete
MSDQTVSTKPKKEPSTSPVAGGQLPYLCDLFSRQEARELYEQIYKDVKGVKVSHEERNQKKLTDKSLIYGEACYDEFCEILQHVQPNPGSTFYDLGSGIGKALVIAAMTVPFAKVVGAEMLEGLHAISMEAVSRIKTHLSDQEKETSTQFEIHCKDLNNISMTDADIVFISSTCFSDSLMDRISRQCEQLKTGAKVVSLTRGIQSSQYETIEKKHIKMSWGSPTLFIQEHQGPTPASTPKKRSSSDEDA